jgi:hypothetical protein
MAQEARQPLVSLQVAATVPLPPAIPGCAGAAASGGVVEPSPQKQPRHQQQHVPSVPPPPARDDDDEGMLPPPPGMQKLQTHGQQQGVAAAFTGAFPSVADAGLNAYSNPDTAAAWKQQQQQQYYQQHLQWQQQQWQKQQQQWQQQQPQPQQQPQSTAAAAGTAGGGRPGLPPGGEYLDAEKGLNPLLVEIFDKGELIPGRTNGGYRHIALQEAERLLEAAENMEIWLFKGAHSRRTGGGAKPVKEQAGASVKWTAMLHELHEAGFFQQTKKWEGLRDRWNRLLNKWREAQKACTGSGTQPGDFVLRGLDGHPCEYQLKFLRKADEVFGQAEEYEKEREKRRAAKTSHDAGKRDVGDEMQRHLMGSSTPWRGTGLIASDAGNDAGGDGGSEEEGGCGEKSAGMGGEGGDKTHCGASAQTHGKRSPHARGLDALERIAAEARATAAAQAAARDEFLANEKEKLALHRHEVEERLAIAKAESEARLKREAEVGRRQEAQSEQILQLQLRQCEHQQQMTEILKMVLEDRKKRDAADDSGEGGGKKSKTE